MMAKGDEEELKELMVSFENSLSNNEEFLFELLNLKQAKKSEHTRFGHTALRPAKALKTVVALLQKLDDAEVLFRSLHTHSLLSHERHTMTVTNTATELKFSRTRSGMLSSLTQGNALLGWFPEVLETMREAIKNEVYALVNSQQTGKKVQEISLAMLGVYCRKVGIRYSYAQRSYFYRLARWLLDDEDPKAAIIKAKQLYIRAVSEGIKVP